jgi:uncharacterized membrane protein
MENSNQTPTLSDFISFKSMISLKIIQILYVVGAIMTTLSGFYWLFLGSGALGHFLGLMVLLLGNVFWRVWCELMIIFFRINETLNIIEVNTKYKAGV